MLDRIGCGYLLLDDHRNIVEANATARLILGPEDGSVDNLDRLTSALKQLLQRGPNRSPLGPLTWIVIWSQEDAPFVLSQSADDIPAGRSVVMLLNLDAHLEPNPFMLRRMFGLTLAETRLALELARGGKPVDVARVHRVSRTTVRSQLASLFAKTQTRRQSELVNLLARIALLP
ncbi:helix-turn-helix transcriptional regulator [Bosea sp. BIWAKO-01]|uniref:helix-turn-helix transcriptional regulator n=1 Tax=Bosea sp. BIWAKO-01 TaxID=506668 RepID=UPI00114D270F|nr:helix-turn-helix transcriptional regulator [Bosea sp. BIWAKO-01]